MQKVPSFGQVDQFSLFSAKEHTFLQLFVENPMKTLKHGSLFKLLLVLTKSMSFHGFSENHTLSAIFSENLMKTLKHGSLFETLLVLTKSMSFHQHVSWVETLLLLSKSMSFYGFSQNHTLSCIFLLKT